MSLVVATVALSLLFPVVSAEQDPWQVLVEDQDGFPPSPGGRADITRVLLDPGNGRTFRLAVESPVFVASPTSGNDSGEFLVSVFFELRPLYDGPAGAVRAGAATQFRLNSLVTTYPYGDDAAFRLVHGDVLAAPSHLDGQDILGTLTPTRVTWILDRAQDLGPFREELPPDRPWEVASVFAEARTLPGGPLVNAIIDSTGAGYERYDALRTDRAPDSNYGRRGTIPAAPNQTTQAEDPTRASLVQFRGASSNPEAAIAASAGSALLILAIAGYYWVRNSAGVMPLWLLGLFSRIVRSRALDNDRRRLVHDAIYANPGITFGRLRSLTEVGSGPLAHHLKILEQNRLLVAQRVHGRTYYYLADGTSRGAEVPPSDEVVAVVERSPHVTPTDVATALGKPRSTVAARLKFWERVGRLKSERDGRLRRYRRV